MRQNTDHNSLEAKSNKRVGGFALLVILIFGGGYLLYWMLPYLIAMTANILYLFFFLLIAVGFFAVVIHPKTRFLIGSFINSFFRKK
jgi:hypothetical protein